MPTRALPPSVPAAKPPDGDSRSGRNRHRSGIFARQSLPAAKSYRFGSDSGIGQLAAAINRGDKTAVKTVFQQDFTDIEKRLLQSGEDYIAMLEEALAGYGRYLDLLQARAEPDLIIQAFNEYQLLCALRGRLAWLD